MSSYTPLLSQPPDVSDDRTDGWGSSSEKEESHPKPLLCRATTAPDLTVHVVVLACVISAVSLILSLIQLPSPPNPPRLSPTKLTYPDPYIGLESAVLTDATPAKPIINFPLLLAQINSSEPSTVYMQLTQWPTAFGMIYPELRHFEVDNEASTVVQFRTIDFGMERCVVTLEIPEVPEPYKNFSSSAAQCPLEVWSLEATENIQRRTLSWSARPQRSNLLTTMFVGQPPVLLQSPSFHCPPRTLFTFEIAYSTVGCHLRFRQDPDPPRLALYLTQYPSGN